MKKAICAALIPIMICAVFSGCTPTSENDSDGGQVQHNDSGSSEEKTVSLRIGVNTTLSMYTYADPEIKSGYDFLKKAAADFESVYTDADVEIDVLEIDSYDEDEAISGAFDTPYAMDIILKEYMNMSTYIHTGRVVPLDDIITDEIRNDIGDEYWNKSRYGGKTYMMPFLTMQNVLAYNKDMFREAGLEEFVSDEDVVSSWSLEEWDYVLDTLAAKLPPNVYPMMMYAGDEQGDTHIMTLLRSRGCPFFDENGRFCINCKEGADALQWIQDGCEKGYFPPNSETMTVLDNMHLFTNKQLAINLMNTNLESFSQSAGIDFGCVNFPYIDDKGCCTAFTTGFEVFDNGDADKIAVSKAFVRYIYESDWLDCSAGSIPVSKSVREKYAEQLSEHKKYIDNTGVSLNITDNNPNWRGVRSVFYDKIGQLLYGDMSAEQAAAEIDAVCNEAIEYGYENSVLHP